MAEQRIKILRATDRTVISFFEELAKLIGCYDVAVATLGFCNLGKLSLVEGRPEELAEIYKKNSKIISTMHLQLPEMPIIYFRGGNYGEDNKSAIYDEIVLRKNNQAGEIENSVVYDIITLINKKLKAIEAGAVVGSEEDVKAQFGAAHAATIDRLEHLNEDLINKTHEYRGELDRSFEEKRARLDKEFEDERKRLREELDAKEAALQKEKDDLENLRKSLDDKSNTHARREIRRDILREIKSRQERFSLTEGTNSLRKPIFYAMSLLVAVFLFLGGVSSFEFYTVMQGNDLNKIILSGVKQTLYFGGAIASIIFMIRWMNRWFELHSQSEFELKSFELDMERASWIVETSLEWKDAKDNVVPPELLESLSRNLFTKEEGDVEGLEHPADQLASALLGSASNIKLKSGDSLLEIDPKKLKKASLKE